MCISKLRFGGGNTEIENPIKATFLSCINNDRLILSKNKSVDLKTFVNYFSQVKTLTYDDLVKISQENNYGYESFLDRKSTRLNSSHVSISYAVFCLKKKNH